MAQLIVTVNKLNVRSKVPTNLPDPDNITGTLNKGYTFEGTEIPVGEIPNPALGKFYKDNNGMVVWGGGLTELDENAPLTQAVNWQFDATKMSWAHDSISNGGVGIVDLWNQIGLRGEGITVAIIDTGASYLNNDLNGQINLDKSIDCCFNNSIEDTDDPNYHGTLSSGVIAANAQTTKTVIGVAPGSNLIIYRLFSNDNLDGYADGNFCYVLQEARKANVDIISMSFVLPEEPQSVSSEIQACLDQNILMVASVGDDNQNLGETNYYPSSFPNCISVGAYKLLNNVRTVYSEESAKSNNLFCLGPGDNILTTGITGTPAFHQYTSAAAPFVAGILALILSYRKAKKLSVSAVDVMNKLQKACDRINGDAIKDDIEGYGIINPITLFNLLKN